MFPNFLSGNFQVNYMFWLSDCELETIIFKLNDP
jgi:hypothetical protein